jgi:methionyl-tRNA formyltransferase
MRIVMLTSSLYSESACATAAHLAQRGYVPAGLLSLRTLDPSILRRKLAQWGTDQFVHYARSKLARQQRNEVPQIHNPYLEPYLRHDGAIFRTLKHVAKVYGFPTVTCAEQNSSASLVQLKQWAPDLIVFAGGNILRKEILQLPRLGVINVHLGLLPETRGMSSPEWSLLKGVPTGITIHYVDTGIDTGPVLRRSEFRDAVHCSSLADLRHRLIAFGIQKLGEIVVALDRGTITAARQVDLGEDRQFFVMHDWLQGRAGERLIRSLSAAPEHSLNG